MDSRIKDLATIRKAIDMDAYDVWLTTDPREPVDYHGDCYHCCYFVACPCGCGWGYCDDCAEMDLMYGYENGCEYGCPDE